MLFFVTKAPPFTYDVLSVACALVQEIAKYSLERILPLQQ